jgi:tetratricopeptide (TPR) repeat protein
MLEFRCKYVKISVLFIITFLLLSVSAEGENPDAAWIKYEQAAALFKKSAPATEMIHLLKEVQSSTQDSVLFGRSIFLMAETYQKNNQPEKAVLELLKFSEPGLNFSETMVSESFLRIGLIYLRQNEINKAKSYFNKVVENKSNLFIREEAILGLAWIAAEQGEWTTSDSLLTELESNGYSEAADERVTLLKARQAISQNQYESAISMLANTQSKTGLFYLANAYEKNGNRIMAVSIYKKMYDLHSNTPEAKQALFLAAEVFMRAGDWLAARSEFKRLLNSGYQDEDAIHFRLGWINMNLNQLDEAITEFRSAHASEYGSYFKYMEAECLRRQGAIDSVKLDKSLVLFHNIASIELQSPLAPLAKLKAALTEMEKGDSSGALVTLRQFVNLYPKDDLAPAVYFLLGTNESPMAAQRYLDQIIQQSQKSQFFDVSYFALQNHDFKKGDYQKVITRNASMPQQAKSDQQNYWQRANHLLMGESAYFLKHYQEALVEYGLAKNDKTDDLTEKASIGEVWCKLHLDGTDSALAAFGFLRKNVKTENKILVDYGYATMQFLKQNYMEALKAYPVSIQTQNFPEYVPLVVNSLFRSGQCYYRLKSYMQAIETWDKLASEYPNSNRAVKALFNIADVYFRANHFSEADSVYQIVINNYPDDPVAVESALKLAQSAYNAANYEEAVARYQSFIDSYPEHEKNKEALEGIQLSYYQMGQVNQASEILRKVVEQTTNSDLAIDARYRIAMNYYQEENYEKAIEAFKEILALYPNSTYAVDAQYALSKCYLSLDDYQSALAEYLRFVQYFPESPQVPEVYFLLGVGYYQVESYLSAIDYFNKVIQDYSNSEYYGPSLKNSAWCYDNLLEKEKAIQAFSSYLEEYPSAEDAQMIRLQIGRLLLENGNTQDALAKLEALQNSKDLAVSLEASYRLGMNFLSTGEITKAEQKFKIALNQEGGDNYYRLSSLAQLAAIYENQGENQKAITTYEVLTNSTNEERWTGAARERIEILKVATSQQ